MFESSAIRSKKLTNAALFSKTLTRYSQAQTLYRMLGIFDMEVNHNALSVQKLISNKRAEQP